MAWTPPDLSGRVAVVTGATRGVGRGVAEVLGECRATVYVTGRSTRDHPGVGPGTIEETAAAVDANGGWGVAVRVDHTDDADVEALFARVRDEQGGLDLLVANSWGGYQNYDRATFTSPFWEQPISRLDTMFATGLRTQFTAARGAAPMMLERGSGLIVCTGYTTPTHYLGSLPYDVVKAAVGRLVVGLAHELRPHGVNAVGVWPGFTRTEAVVSSFAAGGQEPPPETHSPQFVGRAIASLLADPELPGLSGHGIQAAELAARYGFTDVDDREIAPFAMPEDLRLA